MDKPPRKLLPGYEPPPEPSPTSSSAASPSSSSNPVPNTKPYAGQPSVATPTTNTATSTRRQVTSLACNECRRVKCKCDGERPTCGLCERKGLVCDYDVGPRGRTALMALRHQYSLLETENGQLRELLRLIASLPTTDASEVLDRLRTNEDPLRVLQMVQAARLLMSDSGPPSAESQSTEGSTAMTLPPMTTATAPGPQHTQYSDLATRIPTEALARPTLEDSQRSPLPRASALAGVKGDLRSILNAPEE